MYLERVSMASSGAALLSFAQAGQQAINSENTKLFWILFFIAFAFLVIALAVVVLVVEILKTRTKVMAIVNDLHVRSLPILDKSTHLIGELGPKVEDITGNVQQITLLARNKVEDFEPAISAAKRTMVDVNEKTHEQLLRVNEMVTEVLNSTQEIVEKVDAGVKAPFREASNIWTGVKVGWETLRTGQTPYRRATSPRNTASHADAASRSEAGQKEAGQDGPGRGAPRQAQTHSVPTPASAAEAAAAAFARAERKQTL